MANEWGLSASEMEQAMNLEKLYGYMQKARNCTDCFKTDITHVDVLRHVFVCASCAKKCKKCKRVGEDKIRTSEVEKIAKIYDQSSRYGSNSKEKKYRSSGRRHSLSKTHRSHSSSSDGHSRRRSASDLGGFDDSSFFSEYGSVPGMAGYATADYNTPNWNAAASTHSESMISSAPKENIQPTEMAATPAYPMPAQTDPSQAFQMGMPQQDVAMAMHQQANPYLQATHFAAQNPQYFAPQMGNMPPKMQMPGVTQPTSHLPYGQYPQFVNHMQPQILPYTQTPTNPHMNQLKPYGQSQMNPFTNFPQMSNVIHGATLINPTVIHSPLNGELLQNGLGFVGPQGYNGLTGGRFLPNGVPCHSCGSTGQSKSSLRSWIAYQNLISSLKRDILLERYPNIFTNANAVSDIDIHGDLSTRHPITNPFTSPLYKKLPVAPLPMIMDQAPISGRGTTATPRSLQRIRSNPFCA